MDKRLKTIVIDSCDLLDALAGQVCIAIPRGSTVLNVEFDMEVLRVKILIQNPVFEVVPTGNAVPWLGYTCSTEHKDGR